MGARFTITMSLRDNYGDQRPLSMAVDIDEAMRISPRAVDEIKAGLSTFSSTVEMMKVREFRRDFLIEAARNLAARMADTLADAEGWHDINRVEPARNALGWEQR